jgi:hypothetical protein
MFRSLHLILILPLAFASCILDRGAERRSEILPGRYLAARDGVEAAYEFRADGSFDFTRTDAGIPTLAETGRWEYIYVGPDERYLAESQVTRRELGSDSAWHESQNPGYRYVIAASTRSEFHLLPDSDDPLEGLFVLFLVIEGPTHVVFRRQ